MLAPMRVPPAWMLLCVAGLAGACGPEAPPPRLLAEEALVKRQLEGLREMVAAAERNELLSPDHLAIGIEESLVRDLLDASLPVEGVLAGAARVRLERAEVTFRATQGLVTVSGRVSPVDSPDTFADLTLKGSLDQLEVDGPTGKLTGRLVLDDLEIHRAAAAGTESALLKAAIETLGREGLASLQDMLPPVAVPIRLDQQIEIEGFGDGPVSVGAARLPLTAAVTRVLPLSGRLWVMIRVKAEPWQKLTPERGGSR